MNLSGHIADREPGERTDRGDPQPAQQIHQFRPTGPVEAGFDGQLRNRQRRQPGRVTARLDALPEPRGEHRGEHLIGHPGLRLGTARSDDVGQPFGDLLLLTEVVAQGVGQRYHQQPRPQDLDRRHHRHHRSRDRLVLLSVAVAVGAGEHHLRQAACACRFHIPRRTPLRRADAEHATTRLACSTATGTSGARSASAAAALAGQSGHHSAKTLVPALPAGTLWRTATRWADAL